MNIKQAKEIVISAINDAIEGKAEITEDMQLIGGESLLDSMKLVEVCIALEDLAEEHEFDLDQRVVDPGFRFDLGLLEDIGLAGNVPTGDE